jgi:hypothetical protein
MWVAVAPTKMEMPPAKILFLGGANVRLQKSCIFAVLEVKAELMAVKFVKMFFSNTDLEMETVIRRSNI